MNDRIKRQPTFSHSIFRSIILGIALIAVSIGAGCSSRYKLDKRAKQKQSELAYAYDSSATTISHVLSGNAAVKRCGYPPLIDLAVINYNRNDSLTLNIRLATSTRQGKISGNLKIITDSVEIFYESQPQSFPYRESLEEQIPAFGSTLPGRIGRGATIRSLLNILTPNRGYTVTKDQLWNDITITLDPSDYDDLASTSELFYSIEIAGCDIELYPNRKQITMMQDFWFGDD